MGRDAGGLSSLKTTLWALWCRDAGCLSGVGTYHPGTVGHGGRLFKQCLNLPPRHCGAGVPAVKVASKHTSQTLLCRGGGCLSSVGTYLLCTVGQGCRLFKQCPNLLPGHCGAVVQAV